MMTLAPSAIPLEMKSSTRSNWILDTTGPTSISLEVGSPTVTAWATFFAIASTSASRLAGTSMRVGALQDWPEFSNTCNTPAFTARSKSASSSSMLGDLPPSSWCTRLTVVAASLATSVPARVDPVNDTMSTSGCDASAAPTSMPVPLMRLNTPLGTPASCITSAQMMALKGENSDGFRTMVQPAARAGTTFAATWLMGQFQGVISAQTPMGSSTSRVGPWRVSNSNVLSTS